MQITHYTDYSLRVLIFLSLQEEGQRLTITNISDHFKIPRNHLVKVVHKLGKLNYIHTTRGKNGGLRLQVPADQIQIGKVVRHMENTLDIVNCDSPSPCPLTPGCALKSILQQATNAFIEVLDQYTIADLQHKPNQLKTLLNMQAVTN